ncbi:hypothetical protein B0H19DRAFT_1129900 [Mycena capillaripes]|nr:hypothetical protein B0H19DRAFT_1129900 [Mycena capillaripes]
MPGKKKKSKAIRDTGLPTLPELLVVARLSPTPDDRATEISCRLRSVSPATQHLVV